MQQVLELGGERGEPLGVLEGRLRIVDRARPDDHHQPRILAVEDGGHLVAVGDDALAFSAVSGCSPISSAGGASGVIRSILRSCRD